jgi:hypothetical protein
MFFSKSTKGFYHLEIHGDNMPLDSVEITQETYLSLLNGQSEGKVIDGDEEGNPILLDPTPIELRYDELRSREYPPIADYLDGVVKGNQSQIDAYIEACQAVKLKYPKPV